MTDSANVEDALYNIWPNDSRAREVAAAVKYELPDGFDIYRRWADGIGFTAADVAACWTKADPVTSSGLVSLLAMADTVNNAPKPDALKSLDESLRSTQMTDKRADEFEYLQWVIPNLISAGRLHVFRGIQGALKTSFFTGQMPLMVARGYDPHYMMMDAPGDQLKEMHERARNEGWTLHAPENPSVDVRTLLKSGIKAATELGKDAAGLADKVFVFDTVKSFMPLDKTAATQWLQDFKKFRTETGATVILIHHSVKLKKSLDPGVTKKDIEKLLPTDGTAEWDTECDEKFLMIAEHD